RLSVRRVSACASGRLAAPACLEERPYCAGDMRLRTATAAAAAAQSAAAAPAPIAASPHSKPSLLGARLVVGAERFSPSSFSLSSGLFFGVEGTAQAPISPSFSRTLVCCDSLTKGFSF